MIRKIMGNNKYFKEGDIKLNKIRIILFHFGILLIVGLGITLLILIFTQPVMGDNLVLNYPMDEGNGDTVYDKSGNGNNGDIYGAHWTNGISGNALEFDSENDYIDCGKNKFSANDSFTISAWVNPGVDNNNHMRIFDSGNSGDGWFIGMDANAGDKFQFELYDGDVQRAISSSSNYNRDMVSCCCYVRWNYWDIIC